MGHQRQGNYPYPDQRQQQNPHGYGGPPEQHYPGHAPSGHQNSGPAPSPYGITPVAPQRAPSAPAGPHYGGPAYGGPPPHQHNGGSQFGGSHYSGSQYSHQGPPIDQPPEDAIHQCGGATMTLKGMQEQVLNQQMSDNFEVLKKLGQGGFGTVWLCRRTTAAARGDRKQTPEYFALKELSSPVVFKPGKDQDIKKCLPLDEAAIQQYMKHEAIVETYWADVRCLDPKTNKPLQISAGALNWTSIDNLGDIEATYTASLHQHGGPPPNMPSEVKLQMRIAMENCDLGALKDFLIAPGKTPTKPLAHEISWKRGSRIDKTRCALLAALDIAEAIKFMHKSATLHGDLKPHNILLVSDPQDEKLFRAKVSDFGLSHHMTGGQTHVDISQGTEAYLPMEVFQKFAITEATDVYSLGLLMWEIFYGIFWFTVWDAEKKRKGVRLPLQMEGYRPSCSASCPPAFASIIHDCLSTNPEKRPSAGDVVHRLIACMDQIPGSS